MVGVIMSRTPTRGYPFPNVKPGEYVILPGKRNVIRDLEIRRLSWIFGWLYVLKCPYKRVVAGSESEGDETTEAEVRASVNR